MSSLPDKRQRAEDAFQCLVQGWKRLSGWKHSISRQVLDSQHLSFFYDLEDLPQPSDQPNIDGCPIIELQDTVEDIKYLFDGAV
ncbi:hypothetical protein K438DRAFT_1843949 [Mycena galopus ATCC 62051]|nr:hypothetical protein K438DRAFT_1843949 [Mycena galopus ATCC 62051]